MRVTKERVLSLHVWFISRQFRHPRPFGVECWTTKRRAVGINEAKRRHLPRWTEKNKETISNPDGCPSKNQIWNFQNTNHRMFCMPLKNMKKDTK